MSDPSPQVQRNLAVGARLVEINEREGPDGVLNHFDEVFRRDFELRPAGEDLLLLLSRLRLVGKESGLDLNGEYAMFVRLQEGRMAWGRAFLSHAEAEAAAADA